MAQINTVIGVRGANWNAEVTPWGDIAIDDQVRLQWFVAADDRWHQPSKETTVRQRKDSGVPVIETRLKVPGGDAVQTVYAVANHGGVIVVEIFNDSSLPLAVAFDRNDISTQRPPSRVEGIDLPESSIALPIGHHSTIRVAIVVNNDQRLTPAELEALPSADQVRRGWIGAVGNTSRIVMPEHSWSRNLTVRRCEILLSLPHQLDYHGGSTSGEVEIIIDRAERVRMGENGQQWVNEVAQCVENIAKHCRKTKVVAWDENWALIAAGMILERSGEHRGAQDLVRLRASLANSLPAPEITSIGHELETDNRYIALVESHFVELLKNESINVLPRGFIKLGINFECHNLLASPQHRLSFAIRWHGELPALLWEIDGPAGAKVVATALDKTFSTLDPRGEKLLTGFSNQLVK